MLRTNFEDRSPLESTLVRGLAVLFVALSLVTAVGCGGRDSPVEEAADDVGDAVDEGTDAVEDAVD